MDQSLLASICLLIIIFSGIGVIIFILWYNENKAAKRRKEILSMANNQNNDSNDINNQRQQRRRHINTGSRENINETNVEQSANENNENEAFRLDDKKIGKKKLAKLQAKAEAKSHREAEQTQRVERKKKEEECERIETEKRKIEEEKEEKLLKKLEIENEEKKLKEQKEYEKLKCSFNIEDQGFDRLEENGSENTQLSLIEYIKKTKVVYVDELASKFFLNIDDVISKIKQFIDDKLISGVFDDRGKFIYITDEELKAVAKYINQRGRVSVYDLIQYCNRFISLDPIKAS